MPEIKSTYRWLDEADQIIEELKNEFLTCEEKTLLKERLALCIAKAVESSSL